MMGFTGLLAISANSEIVTDLAFFTLLLKKNTLWLSILIIILAISLTISSIDTLINAISSLIIVDGIKVIKFKGNYLNLSKKIIIFICLITLIVSSKGISILYLFLLADLLCCAAVLSIFYGLYSKVISEKNIYISIIIGLISGLLLFPSPDFTKSILIGFIFPSDSVPSIISSSLLFISFITATIIPVFTWKINIK